MDRLQAKPHAGMGLEASEGAIVTANEIKVLIADDHTLILDVVGLVLENTTDIKLTTALTINGVMDGLRDKGSFDLILLDLDMPGMQGVETLKQVRAANDGKPVGIFTGGATTHVVEEMTRNGAAGVIPKTTSMKSLTNAIRFMAAGERYFPLELIQEQEAMRNAVPNPLSDREMSVLIRLAEGMSNREIGSTLSLSEPTVKMHVKSVCKKLDAANRTQAVINARRLKLV